MCRRCGCDGSAGDAAEAERRKGEKEKRGTVEEESDTKVNRFGEGSSVYERACVCMYVCVCVCVCMRVCGV